AITPGRPGPRTAVGVHTIGQTPRPDLTEELTARFPSLRLEVVGALDGLEGAHVPACGPRGYPLETRLRDGTRVVVDAAFVEPLLQAAVTALDARVSAHLVLCAGPFPRLAAPAPPAGSPGRLTPLLRPFDVAVAHLAARGMRQLDVVVPFAAQAVPSLDKWGAAGFGCRVHVFEERPRHRPVGDWVSSRVGGSRAQALVFDYVGMRPDILDEVVRRLDRPVFELGRLALDALEETLDAGGDA
ncbi:MAG: AroM family protein, partial [Gemmatimonadetes bacterium]|nr:AroM family protein [Gemmatimonadota bacterium]